MSHWGRAIENVPRSTGGPSGRRCHACKNWRPIAGGKITGIGTPNQRFKCRRCLQAAAAVVA